MPLRLPCTLATKDCRRCCIQFEAKSLSQQPGFVSTQCNYEQQRFKGKNVPDDQSHAGIVILWQCLKMVAVVSSSKYSSVSRHNMWLRNVSIRVHHASSNTCNPYGKPPTGGWLVHGLVELAQSRLVTSGLLLSETPF